MDHVELEPRVARDAPVRTASLALRFDQLLVFAAVALPVVVSLRLSLATVDLAYLLRAGGFMLDHHSLLRTDLFTFTMHGRPWLNQQWGAEIALAAVYRAGGWPLLACFRAALAAVAFGLVYGACRARGASRRAAAWLTIGSLVVTTYGLVLRPQMFAFVLFALSIWIVATAERDDARTRLWILPLLVVPWANLHGSFFLVPVLLVLTCLEHVGRRPAFARTALLAAVASLGTALINPYGVRVWSYVVSLSTNPELRSSISEWRPPYLLSFSGAMFFASAVVVAALVIARRRQVRWPRIVALAVFLVMGATTQRAIMWWTLVTPFLVADLLGGIADRREPRRLVNTAAVATIAALGVLFLPWFRPTFASTASAIAVTDGQLSFAPGAYSASVADTAPAGARLFVPEVWASWFELVLPRDPVMIDPRIELFDRRIWDDYDRISSGSPGWQAVVDRWHIDVLVLSRLQQPGLIDALGSHPGWDEVYRDDEGVVLVRSPG